MFRMFVMLAVLLVTTATHAQQDVITIGPSANEGFGYLSLPQTDVQEEAAVDVENATPLPPPEPLIMEMQQLQHEEEELATADPVVEVQNCPAGVGCSAAAVASPPVVVHRRWTVHHHSATTVRHSRGGPVRRLFAGRGPVRRLLGACRSGGCR